MIPRAQTPRRAAAVLRLAGSLLACACTLSGCTSSVQYYAQAVAGQSSLLASSRPVDEWLSDPATTPQLRERLELAMRIRSFASTRLGLPDNHSYKRYADLHRSSALWNVFAAPRLSLTLKTWCYPLVGCAGYRGYFDQKQAEAMAQQLEGEGWDTYVGPVPAYSTLGWLPDPLLNTFINWPEPELARLIFHELAHQVIYVRDDTRFNESFATAVERAGLARWVAERKDPELQRRYEAYRLRQADLLALLQQTRERLQDLYQQEPAGGAGAAAAQGAQTEAQRLARKQQILAQLPLRYEQVRDERWDGFHGFDAYFRAPWNNARIAAMAAYNDDVPAFEALLAREQGDLPRFFAAVKQLAALAPAQREAQIKALAAGPGAGQPEAAAPAAQFPAQAPAPAGTAR
jgi:predicted aminopeptidase